MNFEDLGLRAEITQAVEESGYTQPSPIQAKAIPIVLEGKDLMAAAQTGTGKTAGFTLPILHNLAGGTRASANQVRALILTPTRELAAQVGDSVQTYGKNLRLSSTYVFGGVKINPQMMRLRRGADVLVATPGRLLDLYSQNALNFKALEVLVLDEADRMLDMGFIHDIRKIMNILPKDRQTLLFSATFSDDIRALAKNIIRNPVEVSVTPRNSTVKAVKQWLHPCDKKRKASLLNHLIWEHKWEQVLVFTRTKHGANKLTRFLESQKLTAAAIHGNKSQGARTKALAEFKAKKIRVLVATDIAARGLDIDQLPQVVNYDLPNVPEDYVHRIGRTGRAGATGEAISLVSHDEFKQLSDIERLIQKLIEREYVGGYEPVNELPESVLKKPFKPKKPKKPRPEHRDGQRKQVRGEQKSGQGERQNKRANKADKTGNSQAKRPNRKPRNTGSANPSTDKPANGNRKPRKRSAPKY
jgi:ATP-dependent RNA helicase RhlE